ncbi:MAG: ferritin-like domain-containing protein [Candidatus Heimdallarchaeota archaeon]|nr:MAG: ferritin-like domain-containing protein [Candidatus Heimdallarchaeota archaeon]
MDVEKRIQLFKNQIELEKQIVQTAESSAKNIGNEIVREMILGIAMDSRKHESFLNTLIGLHEKFALIDEELTDQLKQNLEQHIKLEKKAIDSYQNIWSNLEDEKEKIIIRYILNDEIRHHRLLKQLHTKLVEKLTFTSEDYWDWAWKDTEWGGGS